MAKRVENTQGHRCVMCQVAQASKGLCAICAPRVRAALEEFKTQAEEVAADPKRNHGGFTPTVVLAAMLRQSGWAAYFPYVQKKPTQRS
jgi:hypothetical protein